MMPIHAASEAVRRLFPAEEGQRDPRLMGKEMLLHGLFAEFNELLTLLGKVRAMPLRIKPTEPELPLELRIFHEESFGADYHVNNQQPRKFSPSDKYEWLLEDPTVQSNMHGFQHWQGLKPDVERGGYKRRKIFIEGPYSFETRCAEWTLN